MSFHLPGSRLARTPIAFHALPALTAFLLALSLVYCAGRATAADEPAAKKADETADQKEPPEPEVVPLTTDDDMELKATYFSRHARARTASRSSSFTAWGRNAIGLISRKKADLPSTCKPPSVAR